MLLAGSYGWAGRFTEAERGLAAAERARAMRSRKGSRALLLGE